MVAGLVIVIGFIVLLWLVAALALRLFLPDAPTTVPLPPY